MSLMTAYLLGFASPFVIVAVIVGIVWVVSSDDSLDEAHKLAKETRKWI